MEIKEAQGYESGNRRYVGGSLGLAYINYMEESKKHSETLPGNGFGQMSFYDFLDKARKMMKAKYGERYRELESIPVLVVYLL